MKRPRTLENDTLRVLLRDGDPAADGQDPTPAEIDRMRRAMLEAAVEQPVPLRPGLPVLRWAATAAAALLVSLAAWQVLQNRTVEAPVFSPPPTEEPNPVPQTSLPPEPVSAPVVAATAAPDPEVTTPSAGPAEPVAVSEEPTAAAVLDGPDRSSRQMQFVTARGTRIIWTLNPELDLGSLRSEKGETS